MPVVHESCSVFVPVSKYHGRHGKGKTGVVPLEVPIRRTFDNQRNVYYYAQEGGEVAELFGEFCRKNLCMESWDFVLDSVAYKVQGSIYVSTHQLRDTESPTFQAQDGSRKTTTFCLEPGVCMGLRTAQDKHVAELEAGFRIVKGFA